MNSFKVTLCCLAMTISIGLAEAAETGATINEASPPAEQADADDRYQDLLGELKAAPGESEAARVQRLEEAAKSNVDDFVAAVDLSEIRRLEVRGDLTYAHVLVTGIIPLVGDLRRMQGCEADVRLQFDRDRAALKRQGVSGEAFKKKIGRIATHQTQAFDQCKQRRNTTRSETVASLEAAEIMFRRIRGLNVDAVTAVEAPKLLDNLLTTVRDRRSYQVNIGPAFEYIDHLDGDLQQRVRRLFTDGMPKHAARTRLPANVPLPKD